MTTEEQIAKPSEAAESKDEPLRFYDGDVQTMLHGWWRGLTENREGENAGKGPNRRGEWAELRRCRSPDEVLLTEAYHRIRNKILETGLRVYDEEQFDVRFASVVGLMANVKKTKPVGKHDSLGVQMARRRENSDDARLSGLRFRRLLQIDGRDDLYGALRRVIRLLDGVVDVNQLAKDVYYWRPETSNKVRKRWARDYYARAPEET